MNIIETYKAASSKLEVIEEIKRKTGREIPEIFVELIEAKVVDGRLYRQGRYSKEWTEAKKMIKEENIRKASSSITSMNELKNENEELKAELEKLKAAVQENPKEDSGSESENSKYKALYEKALADVVRITTEKSELEKKIRHLETEVSSLTQDCDSFRENFSTMTVEYSLYEEEKAAKENALKELAEITENYNKAMETVKGSQEQVVILEKENEKYRETSGAQTRDIVRISDMYRAVNEKVLKYESYILKNIRDSAEV